VPNPLALRALRKASRILGGEERLRALLDAPPGRFSRWLQGAEPVPQPVLLMLFDFLSDMEDMATADSNSFILLSGRQDEQRRGWQ
jgi:hypothetical protein